MAASIGYSHAARGVRGAAGETIKSRKLLVTKWLCVFAGIRRHDVAVADELVLVDQQTVHTDRTAGVGLVRTDADLRTEAVSKSVRESRGRVPVNSCGIDFIQEALRIRFVFRNDRVRVPGSVSVNMVDGVVEATDRLNIHDEVEIFGTKSGVAKFDAGR